MREKIVLLGIALLILSVAAVSSVTAQTEDSKDKVIVVSGTGKVTTTPDQAIIWLAVETENADVAEAQTGNAQKMDSVVSALKAAGIPAEDLQTTGYSIYPVTENDVSSSRMWKDSMVKFYRVTNTLQVTLKDVDRTGEIIDIAVANGANRVNNLAFSVGDERQQELRSQALTAAVQQARGDANAVAAAVGKRIVDVKEVNVGGAYVPLQYDRSMAGMDMATSTVPTPIEVGQMDVTASVTITYIIS
jgi:uncharacterized protein